MIFALSLNINIDITCDIECDINNDIEVILMDKKEKEEKNLKHEMHEEKHMMFHRRNWLRHNAMVPKGFLRYHVLEALNQKPMSGSELMDANPKTHRRQHGNPAQAQSTPSSHGSKTTNT